MCPKNFHQKAICHVEKDEFGTACFWNTQKKKAMCGEMSHDESSAKCPLFPGPYADAWDEACDQLSFSEDSPKSCTVETVENSHIQGVTLTYRGPSPGQAKQNSGLRVFCVFFTWAGSGGILQVFCRYSDCLNGLFVDVHFEIFGHSHPCFTEAMTFPSCRGSAYVTAESGVLKFHQLKP